MSPEAKAIEDLRTSHSSVTDSQKNDIVALFAEMRELDAQVSGSSPNELHQARWAYLGILSRSYQLFLSAITELAANNRTAYSIAVRGLIESLCSIAWVIVKPDRLTSLVGFEAPSVGKLINAGYKRHPDLKDVYDELSRVAHPKRDAHLLGFRDPLEVTDKGPMSPFYMRMSESHVKDYIDLLLSIVRQVNSALKELAALGSTVLSKGAVMVRMVPDPESSDV